MHAKERLLALFDDDARQRLDRVPIFVQTVNPDFIERNEDALFSDDMFDYTNNPWVDAALVLGFDGIFGDFPSAFTYEPVEVAGSDGKTHAINTEGREYHAGTRFYKGGLLTSQETLDKIRATIKPVTDTRAMRATIDRGESLASRIFLVPKTGGIFSRVLLAIGYKEFAVNYRKNTRFYHEMIKFRADLLRMEIEFFIAGGGKKAGALFIADDIAYKGRPMIPPERFLLDFGKHYKEILGIARDAGIIPLLHTDGDVTDMVPAFQQVGFRGVQGWEGGCDPRVINERFPGFAVIGFGDMNEVLPFGTDARIKAHVTDLMNALKDNRHFAIGPSSVVNATMPIDNVRNFVRYARILGRY
ncbi:MAG: uroporphyrinogen decarboxylase family protein [Candidatus Sigynarchaeota archaeon]